VLVAKNGALMNLRGSHDQRSYSGDVLKRPVPVGRDFFTYYFPMTDYEKKNRQRLITLLSNLPSCASPVGWKSMGKFAVGGLTEIGFSKNTELLLVISSSGRGVIDCAWGEKNLTR